MIKEFYGGFVAAPLYGTSQSTSCLGNDSRLREVSEREREKFHGSVRCCHGDASRFRAERGKECSVH